MPIATYNDLLVKVPQWAERTDLDPDIIKDFIYLAEAECSQLLRVPAMEHAVQLPIEDGRVVIPFDFLELRRLTYEGQQDRVLKYLSWDQFVIMNQDGGNWSDDLNATYYSRQGPNWFLSPEPADEEVLLCHYYRFIPALDDDTQSNWLLTISPHCYLFGSLRYLFEYVMDNERAAYWEKRFKDEITKLQLIADRAEHMGTLLAVRNI